MLGVSGKSHAKKAKEFEQEEHYALVSGKGTFH
jgi:hypothetical protein